MVDTTGITLLLGTFGILVLLRIPITFCLAFAALVTGTYLDIPLEAIVKTMADGVMNFSLLAIPFFIIMGEIMNEGGISAKHRDAGQPHRRPSARGAGPRERPGQHVLRRHLRVRRGGCLVAGLDRHPDDEEAGLRRRSSPSGLTVCSACQGIIIPPSHNMIIYAFAVGDGLAAGRRFHAGGLRRQALPGRATSPGSCWGSGMLVIAMIIAIRQASTRAEKSYTLQRRPVRSLRDGFLALFTAVIVVGGVIVGVFTATEAAAFALLYAFVIAFFVYRASPAFPVHQDSLRLPQDPGHRHEPDRAAARRSATSSPGCAGAARWPPNGCCRSPTTTTCCCCWSTSCSSVLGLHHGHGAADPDLHADPVPGAGPEDGHGPRPLRHHAADEPRHRAVHAAGGQRPVCGQRRSARSPSRRPPAGCLPFYVSMLVALMLVTYVPAITMWLPNLLSWPVGRQKRGSGPGWAAPPALSRTTSGGAYFTARICSTTVRISGGCLS